MMACHILLAAQYCAIMNSLVVVTAIAIENMATVSKIMTAESGALA